MDTIIDMQTRKALQLSHIFAKIKPFSELGIRLHKNFKPFKKAAAQDLVAYYGKVSQLIRAIDKYPDLIPTLGSCLHYFQWIQKSIEDSAQSLHNNQNALEIHEIFEIKHFIYYYQKTVLYLKNRNLIDLIPLYDFSDLFSFLDREHQNTPSFYLSPSYSPDLEAVFTEIIRLKQQIEAEYGTLKKELIQELELYEFNDKLTISRLKTELIQKLNECSLLTIDYENFANITYVLKKSEIILKAEQNIADLNESLFAEEKKVRQMISKEIGSRSKELSSAFNHIAELDLILAKAIFAINHQCVIPIISDERVIHCHQLVNLVLKDELTELNLSYQPVEVRFDQNVIVLTGANMAGKTSVLKSIGQAFALLLQGIPIPAKEAVLFVPDFIHFSGPITQEHRADLSSFALEVVGLQNIIDKKGYGLVLMDEFARGTNPAEGTALSQSVIHFFSKYSPSHYITATHFNPPQITQNSQHFRLLGISAADFEILKNKDKSWLKNNLSEIHARFNYQMIPVDMNSEPPKAAFMIAELLGLNTQILDKAKEYIKNEK